jgi:hypothetical protein
LRSSVNRYDERPRAASLDHGLILASDGRLSWMVLHHDFWYCTSTALITCGWNVIPSG